LYPEKRITVGVAIAALDGASWKLLLVQRAAGEKILPGVYELPGGNVDPEDVTIFDTVAREALEETGLEVSEVLSDFEDFEYSTKKGAAQQMNFIVRARMPGSSDEDEALTPKLNPEEHQAYVWLDSEAPQSIPETLTLTEGMQEVVKNALNAMRKIKARLQTH
ncbi:NUDIX hydrolase domain-like protein, partial [Mycena maculata]